MHHLKVEDPTWVDLTTSESVAALNKALGSSLHSLLGTGAIILGGLTGENRAATTLIAEWFRAQVLDDGSYFRPDPGTAQAGCALRCPYSWPGGCRRRSWVLRNWARA